MIKLKLKRVKQIEIKISPEGIVLVAQGHSKKEKKEKIRKIAYEGWPYCIICGKPHNSATKYCLYCGNGL